MKRLLPLLLALLLMLPSCSKNEVELTVDNLSEYVQFSPDFSYQEPYKSNILIFHHYDFSYECYPLREGEFIDVEIEVEVILNDRWFIEGTRDSEGVFEQKIVSTIYLWSDGTYESDSYKVFAQQNLKPYQSAPEREVEEFKILSVSGTFVAD